MASSSSCTVYGFVCIKQNGDALLSFPVFSYCKREKITIMATKQIVRSVVLTHCYLSPEGLEVITQSKYSLAAMESSTLFTSLVKLPSTCLLLNASSRLSISDLSMYTGTHNMNTDHKGSEPAVWKLP